MASDVVDYNGNNISNNDKSESDLPGLNPLLADK
jgi:hypothetical protein